MFFYNKLDEKVYLDVRFAVKDDADSIIHCLNDVYSLVRYDENFYNKPYIETAISKSIIRILLALDNSLVAATCGIMHDEIDPSDYCIGFLMVRQKYQGFGVGHYLVKYAIDLLKNKGLSSIKAYPVTWHDKSQIIAEKSGLYPTGILPFIKKSENIQKNQASPQKLTMLISSLNLSDSLSPSRLLYLPDELKPAFLTCSQKLNANYFVNSSVGGGSNKSVINLIDDNVNNIVFARVLTCGSDFEDAIGTITRTLSYCKTIIFFISLHILNTAYCYNILKKDGALFAGFDLLRKDNDFIVMYYSSQRIDFKALLATKLTREVLYEIKKLE